MYISRFLKRLLKIIFRCIRHILSDHKNGLAKLLFFRMLEVLEVLEPLVFEFGSRLCIVYGQFLSKGKISICLLVFFRRPLSEFFDSSAFSASNLWKSGSTFMSIAYVHSLFGMVIESFRPFELFCVKQKSNSFLVDGGPSRQSNYGRDPHKKHIAHSGSRAHWHRRFRTLGGMVIERVLRQGQGQCGHSVTQWQFRRRRRRPRDRVAQVAPAGRPAWPRAIGLAAKLNFKLSPVGLWPGRDYSELHAAPRPFILILTTRKSISCSSVAT